MRIARFALFLALALSLTAAEPDSAVAASAVEIDAAVDAALARLYDDVPAARDLAKKAKGILIFPSVVKAGFGVGGEYVPSRIVRVRLRRVDSADQEVAHDEKLCAFCTEHRLRRRDAFHCHVNPRSIT